VRVLLCIHHHLDPDAGAPGATLALGGALEGLGHEVAYVSFDDLPARMPGLAKEALFPQLAAALIERRVRAWRPDVVDASTGDAWLWALRPGARPPLVTRSHGLEHTFWDAAADRETALRSRLYHGRYRLWEVARSLRAAESCIFLNGADRDRAVTTLGVRPERAHVLPNGVPPAFLGRPLPAAPPAPRIAFVGSWSERKGRRQLAAALTRLLPRHPSARVSLLGTLEPAAGVLAGFPAALHERVEVVPRFAHAALPDLLAGHDVFVLPSLGEGFPLSVLEAMACGLAPVVSDLPMVRDQLRDGETAIVVAPGDAEALERGLERVLTDAALRERVRAAAHGRAQEFGWDRVARRTVAVYEGL
jgi:glycosyltransferase involved in cell wall biosynthesis